MSYTDFLEMYARDVKKTPEALLTQLPLTFPVSTNQRGEALVDFFQRTVELELKGKNVLDIGCAYGGLSIALANAGAKVSAVDVNPKFIEYARTNAKGSAELDLRVFDASSIGVRKAFKKGSFDLIVLNDVLEHIYDTTSLAANLDYLLSETGLVYFKVPNGSSPRFALSEGHRKIFGLTLLDPDCWFHLYPKRASIFYRPLNYFKSIFSYHGLSEISFVNEENVFPRFPIKKLRRQVREVAMHAREFEYPNKTVKVYLRHGIARFREEFEYDVENHSEEYVKFKYGSYFFTGFAGRSNSGVRTRSTVRHVVGIGAVIDPHGTLATPEEIDAGDDDPEDAPVSEPTPEPSAESDSAEDVCLSCAARLPPGQACPSCQGPGAGSGLDAKGGADDANDASGGSAIATGASTNGASVAHAANGAPADPVASVKTPRFELISGGASRAEGDDSARVFLPSFDVRELRAGIAQTPLRPYERFERDSAMKPDLEKLVQAGWSKLGAALIPLKPPIVWSVEDRGIMHRLHSWEPLSALLVGSEKHSDRRWFDAAYAAIVDWLRQFQVPAFRHETEQQLDAAIGQREDMVWYDMGVGFRCYRIAYVLDVVARDASYSDADVELLVRALYFHNAALSRPSFYRPQHNHGVYQALGQLGCARRFPRLPKMDEYGALAAQRIEQLCDEHFFDSGVHKEHSPGYQYMVLNTMIGARNAGLLDGTRCIALLARAEQALMWMVMPDGRVVPIGDTDPRSLKLAHVSDVIYQDPQLSYLISSGKTGEAPPAAVKSYTDAGYVFARLPSAPDQAPHQWSYLAQISGFHSRIHKHADHLSFVWFERGQEVLTDPGRYGYLGRTEPRSTLAKEGYWYSNPKRMYVESTRAHNAVEIDGRDLPRVGVQPFGSALINAADQDGLVVTQSKATFFGSVAHERVLLLRAGQYLVVVDSLADLDDAPHDFTQRFNFAPQWDVVESGLGFSASSTREGGAALQARSASSKTAASVVSRGRNEPSLLGWYSDAENSMLPASSVAFTRGETSRALFVTVFAFGEQLEVEQIGTEIDALSELARFRFTVDGRRTTLELAKDAASVVTVKRTEEALTRSSASAASASVSISSSAAPVPLIEKPQQRRLAITVDVEAQPGRAGQDHVDRLIWGRMPSGTAGIDEMMSIADKHGAKLTMYLDYPEQHLYGESLLDVGREIHRRGHDLQLHLHQQFFDDAFYQRHGIARVHDLNTVSAESARVFVDFLCEQHINITGSSPKGFRGGGYRFNGALLQALADRGVTVDSSYEHSNANMAVNVGPRRQFRWTCGALEVPVSNVFDFKGTKRYVAYNFNASILEGKKTLDSVVRHFDYLNGFYEDYGEDAIAVLVMHSWSLLRLGAGGHYEYCGSGQLERFDALLEAMNGAVEIVTTPQLTEILASGPLPSVNYDKPEVAPGPIAVVASAAQLELQRAASALHVALDKDLRDGECPICAVPLAQFQDYNGPRRRCSGCGSLERQRVLADLYASIVKDAAWRDLRGKRVFIIAPSVSEMQFLKRIGVGDIVSVDVRPEAKPDLVADVCNMPHVPDASFDAVVGSYVLTCVHDVKAALQEFARILRPGGVLYTSDPIAKGKPTEEYTAVEKITSWYGKEAFDKYKVGSFRSLGDLDVKDLYPPQLAVEELSGIDTATGTAVSWHIAAKFADGARPSGWKDRVEAPHDAAASALAGAVVVTTLSVVGCPICGDKLETYEKDQNCNGCGSRARLRALHAVVAEFGDGLKRGPLQLPLLSFAMTGDERQLLQGVFEQFKSVSLFGSYSSEHEMGVDTRDLSRYPDGSFAGHYGSLIFDYFEEHEQALAEAFRVIAPGGVLLTHIAPYRLTDDMAPARVVGKIQQRQGYFEYVPKDVNLPDAKVGRAWFIAAMQRAGFEVQLAQVRDVATGIVIDWFIGVKPASAVSVTAPATIATTPRVAITATPPAVVKKPVCPICDTPFSAFADLSGPRRLCTGCGAVERQRVLADLYAPLVRLAKWRDLQGKRVLAIAPSDSELRFLRKAGVAQVVTVDILPEANPDLLADVCNMPEVADASFDAIVACYILTCVHDLDAALREFRRVLRAGGVLYTSEPITRDQKTEEYTDVTQIASWYGKEAFEKHRVGLFRALGELDVKELFNRHLAFQQATGIDRATGTAATWQIGAKFSKDDLPSGFEDRVQLNPVSVSTPVPISNLRVVGCSVCGDRLESMESGQNCPKCGSRARLRALQAVVAAFEREWKRGPVQLPLLGFAMSGGERETLQPIYSKFKSVSLFGDYGADHEVGVDARDLSRYAADSFSGHFGCVLFDYFHEHEQALAEAFRVVAPGGVLLTHIAPYRMTDDMMPANVTRYIEQRDGYFEYLKAGQFLANIEVGREWFLNEMQRAGFQVQLARVEDVASGTFIDWFIGVKPVLAERPEVETPASPPAVAPGPTQVTARLPTTSGVARTERRSHTFSTPLDPSTGFKRIVVSVEAPSVPKLAGSAEFAYHAFDTDAGSAGDTVYAVQKGGVLVSEDLGEHWDYVRTPETRDARLWNAFLTQDGAVLLQAYRKEGDDPDPNARPPLFVCNRTLQVVEELSVGTESWHGPRAVDQSHGTIIYAEYPENSVKYRADFADKQAEYLPRCRDSAVFRSTDGGRAWSKVFEKPWREIRHFHSVAADPHERGVWYLSSGDKPHESRIWRSSDDGVTWVEVTADGLSVELHPAMKGYHQAVNRYTDIAILPDRVIWGADDLLGNLSQFNDPQATAANRVGSRVFVSQKTSPLVPRTVGFVGNHIRSMIDVGPGYMILTEAKCAESGLRPQVCLLLKAEPYRVIELFTVDRHVARGTGFSYSRASRAAKNGRFFSYRDSNDVFAGGPNLLQWDVAFE